ncbi:TPR repeat-contain kinesin light chain [Jimgerdemannia flammicorona]|uniref:TPR repeat-contain kinesin light chain n=1 Tax=Jimgerdemannia flammicorona TaxID=994334 RepID=A0A433D9B5_9FUNG|nr:TPR repeat-contain kinesin light chain [Jimgerdemannia flammicorona]
MVYGDQGKFDKAEQFYEQALSIHEKVLGSEDPDTAASLKNLALVYGQHKYDKVTPLYERALAIEKVLGYEHLNMATFLNNLALLYFNNASTQNYLAELYKRQGKNKAKLMYEPALEITTSGLGGISE